MSVVYSWRFLWVSSKTGRNLEPPVMERLIFAQCQMNPIGGNRVYQVDGQEEALYEQGALDYREIAFPAVDLLEGKNT